MTQRNEALGRTILEAHAGLHGAVAKELADELCKHLEDAERWRFVRKGSSPYYRLLYDSWGAQIDLVGLRADEVIDEARGIDTNVN